MLISSLELMELIKTNTISKSDYVGDVTSSIADGSQIKNPMYNIKK